MTTNRHLCFAILCGAMVGCNSAPRDPNVDDSPTFGRAVVLADAALRPMLEDHQLVFNATYPDAQVVVHYLQEGELTRAMLADSVRCVFGAFRPGGEQQTYFRTRSLTPHVESVATDAIAVVVSPDNPVASLSVDVLRAMLEGALTVWPGTSIPISLLFDTAGSSVPRTLVDSVLSGQVERLRRGAWAAGLPDLVQRISREQGAIGFIPFAAISDLDDPQCRALREPVKILPISVTDGSTPYPPDQGTLKDGSYPLRRSVVMLVTEGKSGLGTGFASFVAGHKGQRIILKQGLAPERVPARDVEILHE